MSKPNIRRRGSADRFVGELNRALATRGRLEAIPYQALSDHWTVVLQRLFPVWAVVGPGVADPGHIELTSRTVYLASDQLLGTREEIVGGELDPRRILATFGVGIHEVCHAKCTLGWIVERDAALTASDDAKRQQLAVDRRLLEEPRMEATAVREFPEKTKRGVFIRAALAAAVVDVIVPRLAEAMMVEALATGSVSRDLAGRAFIYLGARCTYLLDPRRLGPMPAMWQQVLGADDVAKLKDLCARLIWVENGDNDELDRFAGLYRQLIGDPAPQQCSAGGQGQGQGAPCGEGHANGYGEATDRGEGSANAPADDDGKAADGSDAEGQATANRGGKKDGQEGGDATGPDGVGDTQPTPQSLADALEQAMAKQRARQVEQLNENIDLKKLLRSATKPNPTGKGARGTGRPTGRLPDRGVNRPPFPDEIQLARQYARRLHEAREIGQRQIHKQLPGGKFRPRGYMQAYAQRTLDMPVTAKPWAVTKNTRAPILEPHVGLVVDTSGSMSAYSGSLGPIAWILSEGLREFGGRLAIALFGNSAELLSDGTRPLPLVPGIQTGGGTAFAGDAISLCAEHLEFEDQRRPRFVYALSDGGWFDTEAGVRRIRALRELAIPVVHIAIGCAPLTVEADRVVTIIDPFEGMDRIAQDTVDALKARRRR